MARAAMDDDFDTPGALAVVFEAVRDAIKGLGVEIGNAEIAMLPKNTVKIEGKEAQQMLRLMEAIEDHDDVQHVWANFDIEEKEIEESLA